MSSRMLRVVLALAMVVSACSSGGSKASPASTTTTRADSGEAVPRDEALEAEIRAKGLTVDRARALYAAVVAPLPGVADPPGARSVSTSGTRALAGVVSVFDQLTPAQQQAVREHLGDNAAPASIHDVTPDPDAPDPLLAAPSTTMHGRSARSDHRRVASGEVAPASFFDPYVTWANKVIAAKTATAQIPRIRIHVDDTDTPAAFADTISFDTTVIPLTDGKKFIDHERLLDACQITIYFEKFVGLDPAAILAVITHETFHCFQQRQVGSLAKNLSVHDWLGEGEPTWVMMELVPSAVMASLQQHWARYVSTPRHRPLFARSYDAVGFFGHVEDQEGPEQIWPNLLPAYVAGVGGADETAFGIVLQGVEQVVMDFWGASYWRRFPDKVIWDMLGPGKANLPDAGAAPEHVTVGKSQTVTLPAVDAYENLPVQLTTDTEIVEVVNNRGHLAVAAGPLNDVVPAGSSVFYCVQDEPCVCPTGTTGSPPPAVQAAAGGLALGLTGARTGSAVQARGYSLDDYCKKEPAPPGKPPSRKGGGGGDDSSGGRVYADPHLVTYDGRDYDLQAAGEFVLTRSTVDAFVVQIRTAPVPSGGPATNTVALATKVGEQRLTMTMDPERLSDPDRRVVLRVDGNVSAPGTVPRLSVGSLRQVRGVNGQSFDVTYPDGSVLRARVGAALDVEVVPAPTRRGALTGLLGDFDGTPGDDPTIGTGGPPLSAEPRPDELYGRLAPAWRIGQGESLFDYGAGESTATWTRADFPPQPPPPSPQVLADARAYCTALGVTDPKLLDDCVFDEATTHDRRTGWAYQEQQRFLAWSAKPAGSAAPSGTARTYEGSVSSTSDRPVYEIPLTKGDIVDIGGEAPACRSDAHLSAQLDDPKGGLVGVAADVCVVRRLEAAVTGTYRLTVNSLGEASSGSWRFAVTPVRADRLEQVVAGATISGTIAERVEHDVWRFPGRAGAKLTLGGPSCQGPVGAKLLAPDGSLEAPFTSLCDAKDLVLRSTGDYELVVNADDNRTGSYTATLTLG